MLKKFSRFLFVCTLACYPLSGWAAERVQLKVGYLPILDHLPLLVSHAQDEAHFQHVTIQPKLFKSWREMVGALDAGVINAAFILSPLAMDLFNQGKDIRTILLAHRDGSAITVKQGSEINSAADLRGKAIGIPARNATHTALLDAYLKTAGLSLKDVTTKVIAPPHMPLAMEQNRIDAFIVAEPFGAKAQHDGLGKILVLTKQILDNHVECIVIVKNEALQQHPEAIQEWVNSLIRAGQFIDRDKWEQGSQAVARLTANKYFPHNEETVKLGLQNPKDRISFSDLNPDPSDMQKIVDRSIAAGIIAPIDLEKFIDARFYHAATASASQPIYSVPGVSAPQSNLISSDTR